MTKTIYDIDLDRNPANFQPLTPLSFLERAAAVFHSAPRSCMAREPGPMDSSMPAPVVSPQRLPSKGSDAAIPYR